MNSTYRLVEKTTAPRSRADRGQGGWAKLIRDLVAHPGQSAEIPVNSDSRIHSIRSMLSITARTIGVKIRVNVNSEHTKLYVSLVEESTNAERMGRPTLRARRRV